MVFDDKVPNRPADPAAAAAATKKTSHFTFVLLSLQNNVYFTDSGPLGETSLARPLVRKAHNHHCYTRRLTLHPRAA